MFPKSIERVRVLLQSSLRLNKSRAECLAALVIGVVETRSVLLGDLVSCLPGKAKTTSKYRRLQDFFHEVHLDVEAVARLIMGFARNLTDDKPVTLALDKTCWQARGVEIDILVLSVCLGDIGLPVIWFDSRHFGGTKIVHKISLILRFASLFGVDRIHVLVGDREFVGREWFQWLTRSNIPFVMRLKENMLVSGKRGTARHVRRYFFGLKRGEIRQLDRRWCCDTQLTVCGLRTSKGTLIILACHGIAGREATDAYMRRWNIETGFEKLKSHGFHMESSRLRGKGKMDGLLCVLAIGLAWSYACGKWSIHEQDAIKLKTHNRPAQSVFIRGLTLLRELLHGLAANQWRMSCACFGIFRAAVRME